jgi:hypothetical protein
VRLKFFLQTLVLSAVSSHGFAMPSPIAEALKGEPVVLSVREILSMPGANRLSVAQPRKVLLLQPLDEIAFDQKETLSMRWTALTLRSQLEPSEKVLRRALNAPEWFMRNAALVAYEQAYPKKINQIAIESLKDKALVVRSAAIEVLSRQLDAKSREALWQELDQPRNFRKQSSLWTRPQILKALATAPKANEAQQFVGFLNDKDKLVYPSAVVALEKIHAKILGKTADSDEKKKKLWLSWVTQENQKRF